MGVRRVFSGESLPPQGTTGSDVLAFLGCWDEGKLMAGIRRATPSRSASKHRESPSATEGDPLRLPWLLFWIASISMLGCQTSRSWEQGCPGVYSGIRYYGDQVGGLPVDGKIFFTLDLPLTAVADTILLPVSVFMEPKRPRYGFAPGCTWAEKR